MSMRVASIVASMVLASCRFSPDGGVGGSDDVPPVIDAAAIDGATIDGAAIDGAVIDAPTDAGIDACVSVCSANAIVSCGQVVATCAAGCSTVGSVHCAQIVPSNGVSENDDLTGADADLVLATGRLYTFNTDTGEIRNFPLDGSGGGAVVRVAATPGLDATSKIRWRVATQTAPGGSVAAPELSYFGLKSLTVPATTIVRPIGARGAVIVTRGALTVAGEVDVGGGRIQSAPGTAAVTVPGPGGGRGALDPGNSARGCAPGGNGTRIILAGNVQRDTGGGGGGFGTAGGKGGRASMTEDGGGSAVLAATLPTVCAQANLVPLRGGSGGGCGQGNNDGGGGGGALQLTSFTSITITAGTLYAGGAGGDGTQGADGGGGGGSGGGLLLESPAITITGGSLTAGGGGGGAGVGDTDPAESGRRDGMPADPTNNGGTGATGPNAAAGEELASSGGGEVDGTGGGGGGAGLIHLRSLSAATITGSPVIRPGASTSTATVTP